MTSCLTLFSGEDQNIAVGVPFWYTGMQTLFVGVFCLVAWKLGWSKAPANENIFKVLLNSYEIAETQEEIKANENSTDHPSGGDAEEPITQSIDASIPSTESRIRPFSKLGL